MPTSPPSDEQLTTAHLNEFVLHAAPDAAQIDRVYAIELLAAGVGGLRKRALHTGIVERHIQTPECGDGSLHHRLYLSRILINVRQRDSGARFREGSGCSQTHTGRRASNERDLALEGQIHERRPL